MVKFQELSHSSALCDVTQRHRSLCISSMSSSSSSSNISRCSLCWFSGESGRSTKASGLIHFLPPSPLSRFIRRQRCRRYFVTSPVFEALVFCRRLSNTIEPQEAEGEFKGAARGGCFFTYGSIRGCYVLFVNKGTRLFFLPAGTDEILNIFFIYRFRHNFSEEI